MQIFNFDTKKAVTENSRFSRSSQKDTSTETGVRIQSSLVLVRQNLTIGILGVMGPDSALLCQRTTRRTAKFDGFSDSTGLLRFDRVARKVKRVARDLRERKTRTLSY